MQIVTILLSLPLGRKIHIHTYGGGDTNEGKKLYLKYSHKNKIGPQVFSTDEICEIDGNRFVIEFGIYPFQIKIFLYSNISY
jgi:hypothetical protein